MARSNRKILIISVILILVLGLLTTNIFVISINKTHLKSDTDLNRYIEANSVEEEILAKRGNIYDDNGLKLAEDISTYDIICYLDEGRSDYVVNKTETAKMLAPILDMDPNKIYEYLNYDVYQTELGNNGRNISMAQKEQIMEEITRSKEDDDSSNDYTGIAFVDSNKRVYPLGDFASYIIGFTSTEYGVTTGKMGIEQNYNEYLSGTNGSYEYQTDRYGYILEGMNEERTEATDGNDVYLTLDSEIQTALDNAFAATAETFNVDRSWGAVMEIDTGKVLAWGQTPSYDPNELQIEDYNNYGSQYAYEPGSVMKAFTYAAAIDSDNYNGEDIFDSSPYMYSYTDGEIHRTNSYSSIYKAITNAYNRQYGWITLDEGFYRSSNVATCTLLTEYMTPAIYLDYLYDFGFFQEFGTGVDEITGTLNYNWPSEKLSLTYGQGSSVTMLQLLKAYSAIFSDGTMKTPYFVDKITDSYSNEVVLQNYPEISEQIISEDTALQLQELLEGVVSEDVGTARHYQMDEVDLLAKTGTSQVAGVGGYDESKMISSVMIALPAEDPQYMFYYAYQADAVYAAHQYNDGEMIVLNAIVRKYQLSKDISELDLEESEADKVINEYQMSDLVNHSLEYANRKLEGTNANVVIIGDGNTVIEQMPAAGDKYFSYSNVLLLTDYNDFKMPDMIGWTKSEVIDFWTISGKEVNIIGSGICVEQSMPAGNLVADKDIIEVRLE